MAGSYSHIIDENGDLITNETYGEDFTGMIENLGDAYEAIEEMYDMIEFLSDGNKEKIYQAHLYHIEKRGGNIEYAKRGGVEKYFSKE